MEILQIVQYALIFVIYSGFLIYSISRFNAKNEPEYNLIKNLFIVWIISAIIGLSLGITSSILPGLSVINTVRRYFLIFELIVFLFLVWHISAKMLHTSRPGVIFIAFYILIYVVSTLVNIFVIPFLFRHFNEDPQISLKIIPLTNFIFDVLWLIFGITVMSALNSNVTNQERQPSRQHISLWIKITYIISPVTSIFANLLYFATLSLYDVISIPEFIQYIIVILIYIPPVVAAAGIYPMMQAISLWRLEFEGSNDSNFEQYT